MTPSIRSPKRISRNSPSARELADGKGVPVEGAVALLRNDPKTQGPQLFAQHCANCHSHADAEGNGIVSAEPSAPNLKGFASRRWIAGLLDPHQHRRTGLLRAHKSRRGGHGRDGAGGIRIGRNPRGSGENVPGDGRDRRRPVCRSGPFGTNGSGRFPEITHCGRNPTHHLELAPTATSSTTKGNSVRPPI